MKKKKKWIIGVVVVLIAAIGFFMVTNINAASHNATVGHLSLEQGELVNSIGTKGSVESVSKENVYSTLNLTVKTVYAEVGDVVEAGQILCVLDTEDLELDIAKQKADLNATQKNSLNQLNNNRRIYNEASRKISGGTNSQIVNAEASLKTAEINLQNAQREYDNGLRDFENNTNSQVVNAQSSVNSAKLDLDTKEAAFENNKVLYEIGGVSKSEYDSSEDALISAQNKYNDALISLENAQKSQSRTLEQLENSLETARINYENASASLKSTQVNANQDLENYKSSVESSQISADNDSQLIAIQKLEKQLEDSVIKAPVSGTVTAAYAKEGTAGQGLLFVIEDTDDLKITTKIKEYDVGNVDVGMQVTIKSDSTGDAVYDGVITKIDPTAIKTNAGETDTSSDIEFKATVNVLSAGTDLRIGANTRLTIILEKKENVYYVPYDAVASNYSGESVVYTAEADDQGRYIARQIPVTTGMETDFYVEINSTELTEGMMVISDAAAVVDGAQVMLK